MKRSDHAPKTAKGTNPVVHPSFGEHWNLSVSNSSSQCNSRKNAKCTKRTAENPSNSPKPFVRSDDALCYTTQRINSAHRHVLRDGQSYVNAPREAAARKRRLYILTASDDVREGDAAKCTA